MAEPFNPDWRTWTNGDGPVERNPMLDPIDLVSGGLTAVPSLAKLGLEALATRLSGQILKKGLTSAEKALILGTASPVGEAIAGQTDIEGKGKPMANIRHPNSPSSRGFEDYYSDPMTDFTDKYNTHLPPTVEASYNQWLQTLPENQRSTRDYDLRGYYLAGLNGEDGIQLYDRKNGQHFSDKYKKPNHPTFSDQSIYHGRDGFVGGHWDDWGRGHWTFTPSETNMMTPEELSGYMKANERNIGLIDNRSGAYDPTPQGNSLYRGFVNFMENMTRRLNNQPVQLPQAGGVRG